MNRRFFAFLVAAAFSGSAVAEMARKPELAEAELTKGRRGSTRRGGSGSSGKGGRYVGGRK